MLYSFVIALGVYLGKLKIGGVSLGVTFVLFVGILMGHFGYIVDSEVLKFVREFGLILFIFAIGLQVGPGFFSSFKKGGMRLNGLAVLGIALNVMIVLAIYYINQGDTPMDVLVGVMSGAVTNTPGLAAAQQTVTDPESINTLAMGYAAAYPLGVCGIILAMFIIKGIFRIKVDKEVEDLEQEKEKSMQKPLIETFEVTNKLVDGRTLLQLHEVITCDFVVSRLMNKAGEVIIPTSKTEIHTGDKLYVVMSAQDEPRFKAVLRSGGRNGLGSQPYTGCVAPYRGDQEPVQWCGTRFAPTAYRLSAQLHPHQSCRASICWLRPACACRWATVLRWSDVLRISTVCYTPWQLHEAT